MAEEPVSASMVKADFCYQIIPRLPPDFIGRDVSVLGMIKGHDRDFFIYPFSHTGRAFGFHHVPRGFY